MLEELEALRVQALKELEAVSSTPDLDAWRANFTGKKGALTVVLRGLGQLPAEQRPLAGRVANEVKTALEQAYEARAEVLQRTALVESLTRGAIDVQLPGRPQAPGALHISTQTLREIYGIFAQMGFHVFQAREVEDDETNFQLLNIPPDHPARDMWSTFYTNQPGALLRTHTSPGQIHAMRKYHPEPFRVVLPGKCYRYEQVTARHEYQFHQVEGMVIGRNITLADLKGTLVNFARQMFGPERRLRFRPGYFPFTEPSAEADMDCIFCRGKGCGMCKGSGWIEILGAGMVHPVVLRNGGYDPDEFSGFAFGMGPERIAMLKHGIPDIRYFFANDLRFLQQFA